MKKSALMVPSVVLALMWVFSSYEPAADDLLAASCEAASPFTNTQGLTAPPAALDPTEPPSLYDLLPDSTEDGPAPPENLRIVHALEPRTGATALTSGSYSYYDSLISRSDCLRAYSLRQAWMLKTRQNGGYSVANSRPVMVTYDPATDTYPQRQDAAKIVIPNTGNSLTNQVRLPIPSHGRNSLFVTWDVWFGKEYKYDVHNIASHKIWQFGSPKDRIHTELRTRYSLAPAGNIAVIDGRQYPDGEDLSNPPLYKYAVGPNITKYSTLAPRLGTFVVRPETWTRLFAYFKAPAASDGWWEYSVWAADAQAGPVLIYDRLYIKPSPDVNEWKDFWLEYNTSTTLERSNRPDRPTLVAYARNVVMLKGVSDVKPLLQRP
jgi:hypothetical protein